MIIIVIYPSSRLENRNIDNESIGSKQAVRQFIASEDRAIFGKTNAQDKCV